MQKRILRAQGEREKAASIKKKQRGLLLRLQEDRARIDALRKLHRRDFVKEHKTGSDTYDSTSWQTETEGDADADSSANLNTSAHASNHDPSTVVDTSANAAKELSSSTLEPNEMIRVTHRSLQLPAEETISSIEFKALKLDRDYLALSREQMF